ncbi:MAG TPA: sugar phosphate nucleotidyltransferase [Gaiellaceae bacterium]|nr:sugar phosphate nucleotidyltransferase [Gaiellaceae bacterium]
MKGVILAGGTGSRLLPLTKITNKHLLPVGDRPMVRWAVDALRGEAGLDELMLVTGADHVDDFRRLLGDDLRYGRQERPGGIAEALGLAREFVGEDRVAVLLADNVYGEPGIAETVRRFAQQEHGARVLLAHVREAEHLRHLGVPRIEDGRIAEIVEKPADPPGLLAVTGLYCYEPDVFDVIATLEPSGRGELEITDVNNHYVRDGSLEFDVFNGYWGDAGESIDAYYEVIDRVRRPHLGRDVTLFPLHRFEDERGWLAEIVRARTLPKPIRQTNVSASRQGTIRGLHYHERGQDDLFVCLDGRARIVTLDRETDEADAVDIGDGNFVAVFVPGHLAHGYEALTDVVMLYHVTEEYDADDPDEHGIPWNDPRVAHLWSTSSPILSERDSGAS